MKGDRDGHGNDAPRRLAPLIEAVVTWIVAASLWAADILIRIMLRLRSDERRIRPTERKPWPKALKPQLMRRQDNTCVYCGYRRIAPSMDIDHIVPVVRGGSNDPDNLQVICRPCNQRKGLQTDAEFRARYGRLVPKRPMTQPRRRISQREFKSETKRTGQVQSVQEFKRTRFISKRSKVSSGCAILGFGIVFVSLFTLALVGAEGLLLLAPSLILGAGAGGGVWFRAHTTGAMIEDEG